MNLKSVRRYFEERCEEIIELSHRGDPWVFLCCSTMIDYLTHMTMGSSSRLKYIAFIKTYLGKVDARYFNFTYRNGLNDLPTQMYIILRCGLVHSFSFIPNNLGSQNGGRPRSILLAHEKNGYSHLTPYLKNGKDSVIFTAETFSKDLHQCVGNIFNDAKKNNNLRQLIANYITDHPPILGSFN